MERQRTSPPPLLATAVADAVARTGASHVVGIPDNATAAILGAFAGPDVPRLLRVSREGEAFAMAAGLWLGGARPWVVLQSTGLLESGDALRGTVQRMGVPLPMLVSVRGEATLERLDDREPPPEPALLRRPDVDSAALLTRPTLRAWGVPTYSLTDGDDLPVIDAAHTRAEEEERAVAVLLTAAPEAPP